MKRLWLILFVLPLFAQEYGGIDVKTNSIMMIAYPSFKNQLENIFGIDNLFSNEAKVLS